MEKRVLISRHFGLTATANNRIANKVIASSNILSSPPLTIRTVRAGPAKAHASSAHFFTTFTPSWPSSPSEHDTTNTVQPPLPD